MHEVLVNHLGGLSLPRRSVVRLTDRPDMTIDVNRGRNTTIQQQHLLRGRIISSSIQLERIPGRFSYKYCPECVRKIFRTEYTYCSEK